MPHPNLLSLSKSFIWCGSVSPIKYTGNPSSINGTSHNGNNHRSGCSSLQRLNLNSSASSTVSLENQYVFNSS